MIRFFTSALFVFALLLSGNAIACSTDADTIEGSAAKAVADAEVAVRWHQIRKLSAAPADDTRIHAKHTEATSNLSAARSLLDAGDYEGAMKRAYRVPEILHYR